VGHRHRQARQAARSTYLYHVLDNQWSMSEYGHQCVVWQTAINPVVALELLANGTWRGSGVLGPEAFDSAHQIGLVRTIDPRLARQRRRIELCE
jgi:saccharopine dehydrogenase-like NADP-dependent oxidoreductase